jgi:cell division protein ZapA (FtsZ GTPase activity inhibitor)
MSLVDIKIRNTDLRLDSDDPEKLIALAAKLNRRLNDVAENAGSLSDSKLLIIASLMMEDQMDSLLAKMQDQASNQSAPGHETKKMFNEAIGQISEYIERLTAKVEGNS